MRSYVALGLLPLTLACSFDGTGVNTEGPASSATSTGAATETTGAGPGTNTMGEPTTGGSATTSTGGPGSEVTGEPLTTEPVVTATEPEMTGTTAGTEMTGTTTQETGTTQAPDTSTSSDTGDASSSSTTSDTTGAPACDKDSFEEKLLVENAMVTPPMVTAMSQFDEGIFASSTVQDSGTVSFTFDLPCDGEVAVWGRVLDYYPTAYKDNDPDSFYVRMDGGDKTVWRYGCQTSGASPTYFWLPVKSIMAQQKCGSEKPQTFNLTAGVHTLHLDNREPAFQNVVAAVARVIITTDLGYTPGDGE